MTHIKQYNAWLNNTVYKVINHIQERINYQRQHQKTGISAPSLEEQNKKFEEIEQIIIEFNQLKPSEQKYHYLAKIIRGFLVEFIKQSEQQSVPVNIYNNKNPGAKEYWDNRPVEEYEATAALGKFHSASTFRKLVSEKAKRQTEGKLSRSPDFHAMGEIVRSTIDVFKEEYSGLHANEIPNPSIYNNHFDVIILSAKLDELDKFRIK